MTGLRAYFRPACGARHGLSSPAGRRRRYAPSALVVAAVACVALVGCKGGRPTGLASPRVVHPELHADSVIDVPCPVGTAAPICYARDEVERSLRGVAGAGLVVVTTVDDPAVGPPIGRAALVVPPAAESFATFADGGTTYVVGRDPVGAMYGAFALADGVRDQGPAALAAMKAKVESPALELRAMNHFLSLPIAGERRWWFLDKAFWNEYLTLMAHARLNVLDLHGMFDVHTTYFPNVMPYFATSARLPSLGVSAADRERNRAMLAWVVDKAASLGIRVGLMSYSSGAGLDGKPQSSPLGNDDAATYQRETAEDLARGLPALWRLGFRIGESGRPAVWYGDTFSRGVGDAATPTRLYTRTWLAGKTDMLALIAKMGDQPLLEVKFNGEHLGPPYLVVGGEMASNPRWHAYSYGDYLSPPRPYQTLFQIRTAGTHRVFRFASYARVARLMHDRVLGLTKGFSLEPTFAFRPQYDDYHADPNDLYSPYTFRRDELEFLLFGRLGYDPSLPDATFRRALSRRVGTDELWGPLQAASDVVDWAQTAYTCGPDTIDYAPELEWGGSVALWASAPHDAKGPDKSECPSYHGPFDSFAVASPYDAAIDLVAGRATSRLSPLDVANRLFADANAARLAARVAVDPNNAEARDVVRESFVLADLGDYVGHKLRGASALAVYARSADRRYLAAARTETRAADDAFAKLANDASYIKPFVETFRMARLRLSPYHWSKSVASLARDAASIDETEAAVEGRVSRPPAALPGPDTWFHADRGPGPGPVAFSFDAGPPATRIITASFARPIPSGASVNLLWKSFSPLDDWHSTSASGQGERFLATANVSGGGYFAVEVAGQGGAAWRYPSPLDGAPYVVVPPP